MEFNIKNWSKFKQEFKNQYGDHIAAFFALKKVEEEFFDSQQRQQIYLSDISVKKLIKGKTLEEWEKYCHDCPEDNIVRWIALFLRPTISDKIMNDFNHGTDADVACQIISLARESNIELMSWEQAKNIPNPKTHKDQSKNEIFMKKIAGKNIEEWKKEYDDNPDNPIIKYIKYLDNNVGEATRLITFEPEYINKDFPDYYNNWMHAIAILKEADRLRVVFSEAAPKTEFIVKSVIEWHFFPEIPEHSKDLLLALTDYDKPVPGYLTEDKIIKSSIDIKERTVYAWAYMPDKPKK